MRALLSYDWPGNVRQLENALEYATAVCEGQTIHKEDLPAEIIGRQDEPAPQLPEPTARTTGSAATTITPDGGPTLTERPEDGLGPYPNVQDILAALRKSRHRRGAAAKLLGVSRTTLWRRMREEGLLAGSSAD
jgi:transcriptional regulator of acetoin/glycerol metabolism